MDHLTKSIQMLDESMNATHKLARRVLCDFFQMQLDVHFPNDSWKEILKEEAEGDKRNVLGYSNALEKMNKKGINNYAVSDMDIAFIIKLLEDGRLSSCFPKVNNVPRNEQADRDHVKKLNLSFKEIDNCRDKYSHLSENENKAPEEMALLSVRYIYAIEELLVQYAALQPALGSSPGLRLPERSQRRELLDRYRGEIEDLKRRIISSCVQDIYHGFEEETTVCENHVQLRESSSGQDDEKQIKEKRNQHEELRKEIASYIAEGLVRGTSANNGDYITNPLDPEEVELTPQGENRIKHNLEGAFDDEWKRCIIAAINEKERARIVVHKRRKIISKENVRRILKGLIVILAAAGIVLLFVLPSRRYYIDYTTQYGLPQGIGKISKLKTMSMSTHYEIETYRSGKIELSYRDSYGHLRKITPLDDALPEFAKCVWENIQDDSFMLTFYDEKDHMLTRWTCTNNRSLLSKAGDDQETVDQELDGPSAPEHIDPFDLTEIVRNKEKYDYKIVYDPNGFVEKALRMKKAEELPAHDANGIFGYQYDRDEYGRPVSMFYLDYVGGTYAHRRCVGGYYEKKFMYDGFDLITMSCLGMDGELIPGYMGCAMLSRVYDNNHSVTEVHYYDEKCKLSINTEGYASRISERDERGKTKLIYTMDDSGNPICDISGYHKAEYVYDKNGYAKEMAFYGIKGEPVYTDKGYSKVRVQYDKKGNPFEEQYFDVDDRLFANNNGYAICKRKHDVNGYVEAESYFDVSGNPTYRINGAASMSWIRNSNGKVIEVCRYGIDGNLINGTDGYAIWRAEYNDNGDVEKETFWGEDGNTLVLSGLGYARVERKYDPQGNLKEVAYFGTDGQLVPTKNGLAKAKYEYDKYGNCKKTSFYGVDGNLVTIDDGNAIRECEYNDHGYLVKEAYYGTNGEPVYRKNGAASIHFERDDLGNILDMKLFGIDGNPIMGKDGYHHVKYVYDSHVHNIETTYYDLNDNPCDTTSGYACLIKSYDNRGNITSVRRLSHAGAANEDYYEPTYASDGYSVGIWTYNNINKVVHCEFHNSNDGLTNCKEGYASAEYTYDNIGNQLSAVYHDNENNPVITSSGCAIVKMEYDHNGRMVEKSFYNTNEKPIISTNKYASIKYSYDSRGNKKHEAYYDADGKPTYAGDGYASVDYSYDERNRITKKHFYDISGAPVYNKEGAAIIQYKNDNNWNVKVKYLLDPDEHPIIGKKGYAAQRFEYDNLGNCIEYSFYNDENKLCVGDGGYAIVKQHYYNTGTLKDKSFYNDDNSLMIVPELGFAKIAYIRDNQGNVLKEQYYGADNEPVLCSSGYAEYDAEYDNNGRWIWDTYKGTHSEAKTGKDGAHIHIAERDYRGNITEIRYLGLDGRRYSTQVKGYDDHNNLTQICYYGDETDEEGYPLEENTADGYSGVYKEYDNYGNLISESYYTENWGKRVKSEKNGYWWMRKDYDNRGNVTDIWYYDEDAALIEDTNGVAHEHKVYDNRNNLVEVRYLDVDDRLTVNTKTQTAYSKFVYDTRNNMVERREYDEAGLCIGQFGFATMKQTFNPQDYVTKKAYFDTCGDPIVSTYDNSAWCEYQFDDVGNLISEMHYDAEGNSIKFDKLNDETLEALVSAYNESYDISDVEGFQDQLVNFINELTEKEILASSK